MDTLIGRNILVVGGSGFIGSHLVASLTGLGAQVTCLSLKPVKGQTIFQNTRYLHADISNFGDLTRLGPAQFHYVINLGGYIDHSALDKGGDIVITNHFIGLVNLIKWVSGPNLKKFIQIGSSDEYGSARSPQNESLKEEPISPYSVAKLSSTKLVEMLCRTQSFPGVVLRFFLVYGPAQSSKRFLPQIILSSLENQKFPVSKGIQDRDFLFVADAINGILAAIKSKKAVGKVINIASGKAITVRSMVETVVRKIGSGQPEYGKIEYRPGENRSLVADIKRANTVLNWYPKITIEQGLDITIDWYKNMHINQYK